MNSTPLASQLAASLSGPLRIGREALLMSVSPVQKREKPPPVPETPTGTRTSGATFMNSSATASVIGKTVLEPSISTLPLRSPVDVAAPFDAVTLAGPGPLAVVAVGGPTAPVLSSSPLSSSPQATNVNAATATQARAAMRAKTRLLMPSSLVLTSFHGPKVGSGV